MPYGGDMSQVFRVVNQYYDDFESYRHVFKLGNFRFLTCILLMLLLIVSVLWRLQVISISFINVDNSVKTSFVFILEFLFVISCFSLNDLRDKQVVSNMQRKLKTNEKRIEKLKSLWLQKTIDIEVNEYLSLATELDSMLVLRKKHSGSYLSSLVNVMPFIYSSDSKNRILALFIAASAATVSLSIAAGANINDVFLVVNELGGDQILKYVFLAVFIIFAMVMGIKYTAWMICTALYLMSDKLKNINDVDEFRVSLFIRQLLASHTLKKAKVMAVDILRT